jgi:F-type H+-transporting ATPase subunit b
MELIKNFGLDPVLLGAQIVNFIIIAFILKRFLYKPLLAMLKKREESIKQGLSQAEQGRKLLEDTLVKEKEILKKAKQQAEILLKDSRNQALLQLEKAEGSAKQQSERILEDAKVQIELSAKETEKKLTTYVGKLAIELLAKSSEKLFSQKEQKEIMERALKNINYDKKTN